MNKKNKYYVVAYVGSTIIAEQSTDNVFKSCFWLSKSLKYNRWQSVIVYQFGTPIRKYLRGQFIEQFPFFQEKQTFELMKEGFFYNEKYDIITKDTITKYKT